MVHQLKTWPEYYRLIDLGVKTFELRLNDRNFKTGDVLRLQEWSPQEGYSGEEIKVIVTYVMDSQFNGLTESYVAMGFKKL